jgi:hypothetical protein
MDEADMDEADMGFASARGFLIETGESLSHRLLPRDTPHVPDRQGRAERPPIQD